MKGTTMSEIKVKVGDRYHNERNDVVVTKVYRNTVADSKVQIPEGRKPNPRVEERNEKELSGVWVKFESLSTDSVYDVPLEYFGQGMTLVESNKISVDSEYIKDVVSTFIKGVYSSGGDGCGKLLTQHYDFRELADYFANFEVPMYSQEKDENGKNKISGTKKIKEMYHRIDYDDHVLFSDMSNENFIIGPAFPSSKADRFDDITIIF